MTKAQTICLVGGVVAITAVSGFFYYRSANASLGQMTVGQSPSKESAAVDIKALLAELDRNIDEQNALAKSLPRGDVSGSPEESSIWRDLGRLVDEARALTARLDASTIEAAIAQATSDIGPNQSSIIARIMGRWGQLEGARALVEATKLEDSFQRSALSAAIVGWGTEDPDTALKFAASNPDQIGVPAERFLYLVFTGWSQQHPTAAVRASENLTKDERQQVMGFAFFPVLFNHPQQPGKKQEMLNAIATMDDERKRADLVNAIVRRWARQSAPEAKAWLDTLQWQDPNFEYEAAVHIFEVTMFERNSRHKPSAYDYLWNKAPGAQRADVLKRVSHWASRDREAAEKWLNIRGISPKDIPGW